MYQFGDWRPQADRRKCVEFGERRCRRAASRGRLPRVCRILRHGAMRVNVLVHAEQNVEIVMLEWHHAAFGRNLN